MVEPGTFAVVPAKRSHYIWTGDEEVIVQVQFIGPFGIDYINPAYDPRRLWPRRRKGAPVPNVVPLG
jgi:hypothetical protein